MTKAEKMWETLTEEEKKLVENTLKNYAGNEGIVERMWELYKEGAEGAGKSIEEYAEEVTYGEYIQLITEWDSDTVDVIWE